MNPNPMNKIPALLSLLLLAALLLSACTSLTPQAQPSPLPGGVDPGESLDDDPNTNPPPGGENIPADLAWDTSPETVVIKATNCCGFVPAVYLQNSVPDAIIWGDGRYLWTLYNDSGERTIYEGRLSPEQMAAFLERMAAAGFFGWQDLYEEVGVADVPPQCIEVNLLSGSKTVCEIYQGAPEAFKGLYAALQAGEGLAADEFMPTRAYLISLPLDLGGAQPGQLNLVWDAASLGFALSEAEAGRWIEAGPAIEAAWQAVNESTFGNIVEDGGKYYQLALQIEGLSSFGPPEE